MVLPENRYWTVEHLNNLLTSNKSSTSCVSKSIAFEVTPLKRTKRHRSVCLPSTGRRGKGDAYVIMRLLNIIGHKRGFIIDEPPRKANSDRQVMERFSPPAASLKKRISPPIAWNLGLTSKEPRLFKVILLGHQGVGKTGKGQNNLYQVSVAPSVLPRSPCSVRIREILS